MSITRAAGADRGAGFVATIRPVLPDLLFVLLAVYNAIRLFRHAMWRDELQAFMVAAASNTPLDLFAKLKYEGHPGLWHLLLWVVTRFTADPVAMQVLHLVIALGVWVLVWRLSPFRPVGKLLLLLSYYLFWEYFVVSRGYALGVLLGFGFAALQARRPEQRFWPWVLLGLLANTTVFGTIWSFGLGLFYALRNRQEWRLMLPGVALYAALAALAVVTMVPAPDFTFGGRASAEFSQFDMPLTSRSGLSCRSSLPLSAMCCTGLGERLRILPPHRSSRTRSVSCSRFWAGARAICSSRRPCSLYRFSPASSSCAMH
jgi:hypothetical protein